MQVRAVDVDEGDSVVYSLRRDQTYPFTVTPNSGNVYVTDEKLLRSHCGSYRFRAIATDAARHRSEPAHVLVNVMDDVSEVLPKHEAPRTRSRLNRHRLRRQADTTRVFVANREPVTAVTSIRLFSVASYDPVVPEETFTWGANPPTGLGLDSATGLISRETTHQWGAGDQETYEVVVSRSDDPDCEY